MNHELKTQIEWYKRTLPDGDPRDTADGVAYLELLDTMNYDQYLQAARRLSLDSLMRITPAELVKVCNDELTEDAEAMAQDAIRHAYSLLHT